MKPLLYYLATAEDGFGWGVANTNLIQSLSEFCQVQIAPNSRKDFDAPIFVPIARQDLQTEVKYRAPRVLGYAFAEWPIPADAHRHARIYDTVFAGSTWCAQRLQSAGVKNVQVLLQGIDHQRFSPQPPSQRTGFVVFSGGKYEFRKSQDIVLAAMRVFMSAHSDVTLLAAWHNQWPASMASMQTTWHIDPKNPFEGIPQDRLFLIPALPNKKTPEVYAQAHIGLFPNRCEAGTNLVMCEFMACERPVIATNTTGHKDVFASASASEPAPYLLTNGSYDPAGWFNPNISDILTHLEHAYSHRDQLADRAQSCRKLVERFTWRDCARKIFEAAFPR